MRKVLGSLSLLVLLFNALVTPITYAGEYEEILETSGDNVTEEVVEENGEEEMTPEFSVEEEILDEENEEENEEEEETETDETEELEGLEGTEGTEGTEENDDTENNEDEETTNLQESQTGEETQEQTDPSDDTTVETTETDDNASEDTEEDGEEGIFTPITNAIEDFFNKDNFTKFSIKSEEQNDKSLDVEETFTVTFDANRGTFADLPSPNPQTVSSGSLITNLPSADPELNGYTFTGWFTDPKGGREWNFANDVVTEDITLYAHWTYNYDFGDLDVYIVNSNGVLSKYVMMDRNVGASVVYNQDFDSQNFNSFGYVYQWGNNWGFNRCQGNGTTCHGNNTVNPRYTSNGVPKTIWENYMPTKYASKTWSYKDKNGNNASWQSDATNSDNLWGHATDDYEAKQGPCPDVYHVPLKTEFNDIVDGWNDVYNKRKGYNIFVYNGLRDTQIKDITNDFLLPLAGAHRKGNPEDEEQGGCAEYRSSNPYNWNNAHNIFFCRKGYNNYYDTNKDSGKYVKVGGSSARGNGSTVRCLKNTKSTANLNIEIDKGNSAVITVHKENGINTIIALTDPFRTQEGLGDLHFDGWYTDPNFDPSTRKEAKNTVSPQGDSTVYTLSANETALYAKWSCPQTGYEYNGISCAQRHTITFNASGGTIDVGGIPQTTTTESLLYGLTYNYSDLPTPTRTGFIFKGWYAAFNGIDDYVDYGRDYMFTDQISFHASAYMDTWDTGKRIVSSTKKGGWALNGGDNGKVKATVFKSSTDTVVAESNMRWADLGSGWHDFDFVFDGNQLKLYLDGDLIVGSSPGLFPNGIVYNPNNTILVGAQVGDSTIPDSEGPYYFEGMIKDVIFSHSDQIITSTNALSVPNKDITYYALWKENDGSYNVDVEIQPSTGGNVTGIGLYAEGAEITLTATPNTGYQFTGWYDESDNLISHNNPYIFTADASAGTGLKAVFELKQYTVSAESNDVNKGTILFPIGPYTHGMSIQFSPTVTNPLLYKFLKWTLNGNEVLTGNNKYLTGNLVVELTGNVNVVGFFTGYDTCSFNNQIIQHGGTVTGYQSATVPYNEECVYEIRTCNDGTLDGNYQYVSCSKQGPASCQLPWGGELAHGQSVTGYKASSVTCPNSCESQQATCNNGSWNVENFVANYKSSTCTHNEYSCGEGYTLDTCPAHGTCSEPCTPYTVSENACVPGTQKVKLIKCDEGYQVDNNECTANEYAVIFDANGGNGTMAQDTATYGTNYTIKNSNFTKEGSTFSGWNTKADKSGIRYYSGETILWSLTGDLTLYAQWKLNTYTVTYNAQAHSGTINSQPTSGEYVEYNTVITLPTKNIVSLKSGYQFIGWTTTLNGTEPISDTYIVTENVTFYPIFKKEKVQKDIKFHVNYNSGYIYNTVTYKEDKLFSGCTIPTLYNTDPYTGSCEAHITLADIIADSNTPIVLGWSTGENERTISYSAGARVTITIPEDKEVHLYAQTKSEVKTYEATYEIDRRVEATLPGTPVSCTIQETYNGVQQKTSCEDDLITLPAIVAKTGYNTPVWKLGETEYASGAEIALSGNVIFTGTATPDEHTQYIVKHYYQSGDTNIYELSGTDTLSGATETILDLSTLQVNPNSIPGFLYSGARVNNGNETEINITTITAEEWTGNAEIQPGLIIQLFYTRKSNTVTLNTIDNATVEKIPSKENYYYGETIVFSGHAESGYTFSGWDIKEGDAEAVRREGNNIEYTMISTGVEVTPVIREHKYTIHFDGSGAIGEIDDIYTGYSENITLPTSGDIEGKLIYTGHDFEGWTTGIGETTVITEISKATDVDEGTVTLYAKWKAKIYTVTYDYQAHSGVNENETTNEPYGKEITLPTSGITSQKGYEFQGWTTTLGGTEPISDTFTVTGNVTFYPIFKKEGKQKDIKFYVNNNSGYIYDTVTYKEDKLFSGCTIPTLYNTDPYTGSCSVHITLPDIIAHENTQTVLGWSTGINERTISYGAGAGVTITIPENKEVELYAQTRSEEKTYTATYTTDNRVEEVTKPSDTCTIPVTYNGNPQQTVCTEAITLPNITAKNGYNTPVWKLGEAGYNAGTQIALSGNVILTGTATPDQHTPYVVKHYYQTLSNTGVYELSGTDNLSGATESILTLSELQKEASSIPGFTYWNSRVNSGSDTSIDVTTINDFTNQGEIQPGLVIQLFYTRKNNPVTLHQIGNATVEKTPSKDSYYYGEAITFSGYADEGYTFSGWDIREGDAETGRREGNSIEYTMISTGVEVTPVIREHRYTIHYNASGAVGTMDDETVNYSEEVRLPTAEEVATHFTYTGHHFVGWTTGVAETTVITTLMKATPDDNGEIMLYAKWEENDGVSYSVEYYLEPIEEGRPQSEYILQTADTHHGTAPQGTTVTGTVKYYPGFEKPAEQGGVVETDDSLVIKYYYTRNSYDYTFVAGEGAEFSDGATSKTVSFRYEQPVVFTETIIKTGYTQNGWNPELASTMPNENKTTTAEWIENQYTINYNANGGVGITPTQIVRYTEAVALTGNAFTKEGYVFTGWSETAEGSVVYKDKALVSKLTGVNNAIVTLYAQWSAENYTVTFDANSGEVIPTTIEVTYDATYGELPTPNRTGYTFQGWYTAKEGGTKVISSTQVKTANNHILYAHWTENHYTIAFNANGGEGTMASITNIPYSESTTLTENVFTRNGYRFVGWARISTSTVKEFNDKAIVKELTGESNAIVTLYALWSKGSYKIDYVLNGGALTGGKTNLTGYDVDTASFTLNNPERDGYKFIGWSGTAIDGLSGTVTIAQGSTGDRVYEANWEVKTYTINYELNTGALPAGQTNPATYTIESEDITLINPIRTGYDFNGWSGTAIEGTGNTVTITHGSTGDRKYEANWKIKTYTVTWKNSTGTVLKEEILPYGATPDYEGTPISGADAQYTYTFKGWEPEIAPVTEDQVYTATYNQTINTYTITFKNEDGTELYTTGVAYGTTPVYSGVEPTKENTAQYTYTFNGWSPALAPVTGEAIYTATYTGTINKYMITFVDEDGTKLKAGVEYGYGTVSGDIVQPDEPTKTGDAEYSYTFAGWTPTLTGVTEDQVYTATYSQTVNSYPITFYDEDGTTIIQGPTLYPYGTATGVIVPIGTPTKDSDGTYTYEFDKWTPELKTVVGTADYRATYTGTYIDYLVTFLDSTGAVLTSGYYHSGEIVTIPAGPAKASTAQTGYTFKSWYPEVKVVTGDITYEPTYTETTRSYTITWLSSTGVELRTDTLLYGSTPSYGENPTSGSTAEYEYTFKSWEPAIQTVTEDATYTATYNSTKRKYQITWNNEDGTAIGVTDVEYGVVPAAPSIPKKAFTEQTGYAFNGWNPSPVAVTEAATYTATYAEYTREYTILWKDYDGTVIKTGENVSYGTLIVNNKPIPDPEREATAQTGYTFTGWYDEDGIKLTNTKKLTGDISYTARYDETLRTYTVLWNNRDGTPLETDLNVPYGTIPSYDSAEPTSGADAQYTYHFSGWTPLTGEVTGDQVYTATYISTVNEYQIRFLDENGTTVLQTKSVPYGTVPSYEGQTPTKEGYTFKSWNPTPVAVTQATDYTATYTVNNYNVTPVKGVGVANILGGGSYPYNTVVTLTGIAKEGYHFEGGVSEKAFTYTVPSHNITPQIDAEPNTYHVHFKPNGGTGVMANQEFVYDVEQELSPNAYTRSGFTFISWTDGEGGYYTDKKKVKNLATTGSVILLAQWFEGDGPTPGPTPTPTPSGGGSSGGGGRRPIDKDTQEHASAAESGDIKEIEGTQAQTGTTAQTGATKTGTTIQWTEEELTAYQYAYKYGITTLAPEEAAMSDAYVIRGHMAKMVVNYALNVLNRKLPAKMPKQCKWKDGRNAWESQEIKEYAEKACALGLMGIDMDYFQPNKLVTRAQFGTIFGRLLWGKIVSKPYYAGHLARLRKRGIMTQIDRPEERIEVRKWAWLMFMRSEKYFKVKK